MLTPDIEDAVVEATNKTGVPPQFLKAQIRTENAQLRDQSYRYEPVTIDFNSIGRDGAADTNKPYIARHLFGGVAGDGHAVRCVAIVGPNVVMAVVTASGCRDVQAGSSVTVPINESDIVRARSGPLSKGTVTSGAYRAGYPHPVQRS